MSKSRTQSLKLNKEEKEFAIACQRLLSDALGNVAGDKHGSKLAFPWRELLDKSESE